MIILGIETSCDETAAAVLTNDDKRITILSNVVTSSVVLQAKYGGVIPEQAAREQLRSIIPVIEETLAQAFSNVIPAKAGIYTNNDLWIPDQVGDDTGWIPPIDAIAVTYGPGLIGSLLVGVETTKTLATVWDKPLIPVNHLIGHFYANWINSSSVIPRVAVATRGNLDLRKIATSSFDKLRTPRNDNKEVPTFPCLGLLISGGHTDLVLFTDHGKYKYLGGTRDDAAGECFDKCARLLGLPYPGGPQIAKLARAGNPQAFNLPRPMIDSDDFDFSFSGLKTAVANLIKENPSVIPANAGIQLSKRSEDNSPRLLEKSRSELDPRSSSLSLRAEGLRGDDNRILADLAASIEAAIVEVLVEKTVKAAKLYHVNQIMIAGGVASNQRLISDLKFKIQNSKFKIKLHVPPPELCTDNAAMIAAASFFNYHPTDPLTLQANPNLAL